MEVGSSSLPGTTSVVNSLNRFATFGGLAQLARALAWHARGHRFDSDILHFVPLFIISVWHKYRDMAIRASIFDLL